MVVTPEPVAEGHFELFDEDGIVFYNDPDSEQAGVIHLDGTVTQVAKYNPADPSEDVDNRPPADEPRRSRHRRPAVAGRARLRAHRLRPPPPRGHSRRTLGRRAPVRAPAADTAPTPSTTQPPPESTPDEQAPSPSPSPTPTTTRTTEPTAPRPAPTTTTDTQTTPPNTPPLACLPNVIRAQHAAERLRSRDLGQAVRSIWNCAILHRLRTPPISRHRRRVPERRWRQATYNVWDPGTSRRPGRTPPTARHDRWWPGCRLLPREPSERTWPSSGAAAGGEQETGVIDRSAAGIGWAGGFAPSATRSCPDVRSWDGTPGPAPWATGHPRSLVNWFSTSARGCDSPDEFGWRHVGEPCGEFAGQPGVR